MEKHTSKNVLENGFSAWAITKSRQTVVDQPSLFTADRPSVCQSSKEDSQPRKRDGRITKTMANGCKGRPTVFQSSKRLFLAPALISQKI